MPCQSVSGWYFRPVFKVSKQSTGRFVHPCIACSKCFVKRGGLYFFISKQLNLKSQISLVIISLICAPSWLSGLLVLADHQSLISEDGKTYFVLFSWWMVTRWFAFCTGSSRMPCWTNWAQGSSSFKYLQNWKLFTLDKFWHHGHILPECDVVVAQQFTSLAADRQMNKHQNTFIISFRLIWYLLEL